MRPLRYNSILFNRGFSVQTETWGRVVFAFFTLHSAASSAIRARSLRESVSMRMEKARFALAFTYPNYLAMVRIRVMPLFDGFVESQKAQNCRLLSSHSSSVRLACRQWISELINTFVTWTKQKTALVDSLHQIDDVLFILVCCLLSFSNHFFSTNTNKSLSPIFGRILFSSFFFLGAIRPQIHWFHTRNKSI